MQASAWDSDLDGLIALARHGAGIVIAPVSNPSQRCWTVAMGTSMSDDRLSMCGLAGNCWWDTVQADAPAVRGFGHRKSVGALCTGRLADAALGCTQFPSEVPPSMRVALSRCLFIGQPSEPLCRRLDAELERLGLKSRLGEDLIARSNWHQSLSAAFEDEPRVVEQLRKAGEMITARAVRFTMDRVESQPTPGGVHWWAFRADRAPLDFAPLLHSLGRATMCTMGRKPVQPTAHITISYWACERLKRLVPIEPVEWLLDEVLLVRGGGRPYHYEVIDRWQLQLPREAPVNEQFPLF